MADSIEAMQHSYICAQKSYTKFEWSLKDWSLLKAYYLEPTNSPKFIVSENLSCSLRLSVNQNSVLIHFHKSSVDYSLWTFIVEVSFIDVNKKELFKKSLDVRRETIPPSHQIYVSCYPPFGHYVSNDTLTVLCEITFVKGVEESSVSTDIRNVSLSVVPSKQSEEMYHNKEFSDLTFVIEGKKLLAHKFVLAANSDVFKSMFSTDMKETRHRVVNITDTKFVLFDTFLKYMYTGKIEKMEEVIEDLVILADKYRVTGLKNLCIQFMLRTVNKNTAPKYILIADKLSCEELKKKATSCIG